MTWLGVIFGMTLLLQLSTWLLGGAFEKVFVRMLITAGLFALLFKGFRFARYALATLYVLGALMAAVSVMRLGQQPISAALFAALALFYAAAAGFFVRSRVLQELTSPVSKASRKTG